MQETMISEPATEARERLFTDIYKSVFPYVARYISRSGGSFDEAKDVFQDALVLYYEKKLEAPDFIAHDKAYIIGVARHLWSARLRDKGHYFPLTEASGESVGAEEHIGVSSSGLLSLLQTTGRKCMELLKAFYYEKLAPRDIAQHFGYSGERSATVQKYKCLEKIRNTIKEKSLNYEDFVE